MASTSHATMVSGLCEWCLTSEDNFRRIEGATRSYRKVLLRARLNSRQLLVKKGNAVDKVEMCETGNNANNGGV